MLLKKLVIADDNDAIAHLVAATLGDVGFLCLRARNGEEALKLVRSELPDKKIKEDVLLSRIPIMMLTSMGTVDDRIKGFEAGADDYLAKPFDVRELAARVKALIRQSRRERDRNPTTHLPGGESIDEQVTALLKKKECFSVLYVDVENFRGFTDVYGYRQAEEIVAKVGQVILAVIQKDTHESIFVGHVGGDDFLIICQPDIALTLKDEIGPALLSMLMEQYSEEDLKRGHLIAIQPPAEVRRIPFMNPSIALLNVTPDMFKNTDDLARELARVKARVRAPTGSGFFPSIP